MFKKILLPTDGSEHALKAALIALQMAKEHNSEVEIISVVPMPERTIELVELFPEIKGMKFEDYFKKKGKAIVETTGAAFREAGISYTSRVELGDPAETICQVTDEDQISLVVIGSRGQGAAARFIMGSVSSKVTQCVPCPVLIVR